MYIIHRGGNRTKILNYKVYIDFHENKQELCKHKAKRQHPHSLKFSASML